MNNNEEFNLDIQVCKELNISREELAKILNLSPTTIANWGRGKPVPNLATIAMELLLENNKLKKQLLEIKKGQEAISNIDIKTLTKKVL